VISANKRDARPFREVTGTSSGCALDGDLPKQGESPLSEVEMEIEHNLSQDEAVCRLERLLAAKDAEGSLLREIDYTREDDLFSFTGRVNGFTVSGEVVVFDRRVRILVSLPWAARPFRQHTNEYIREFIAANLR
jgi:hypothetical protein